MARNGPEGLDVLDRRSVDGILLDIHAQDGWADDAR